jgi:hypothetical protein
MDPTLVPRLSKFEESFSYGRRGKALWHKQIIHITETVANSKFMGNSLRYGRRIQDFNVWV